MPCRGLFIFIWIIDISYISGIFTVPVSGVWRISFSLTSNVHSGQQNYAFLYFNGDQLDETEHHIGTEVGDVDSTGGRVIILEASAGDSINLRATLVQRELWRINFCAEFIPRI